jgi:hypothetical protein
MANATYTLILLCVAPAFATDLVIGGGSFWNHFAFERLDDEDQSETPETMDPPGYYGVGGQAELGVGLGPDTHIAGYFTLSPSRLKRAQCCKSYAQLAGAGLLGRWMFEDFYLGLRAGQWEYRLIQREKVDEIGSAWTGIGYGIAMGALWRPRDQSLVTLGLSLDYANMKSKVAGEEQNTERDLGSFGVQLSYVWLIPIDSVSLF